MAFAQDIVLVGLSYRTAPVETREAFAVAAADVVERLRGLHSRHGVDEAWLLSTCNRTEVLCAGVRGAAEEVVKEFFAAVPQGSVYVHRGQAALFHLFRVAAGLDSQVLGESQILSQFKAATDSARAAGSLGARIEPLLAQAQAVGKRVRTETRVGLGTLSIAKAAVELSQKVLGRLDSATALVIGAGETGGLVAQNLRDAHARQILFANRTLAHAEEAVRVHGGEVVPMERIADVLSDVNLTIVSVEAPEPVVCARHFDLARLRRQDRPPMLIDLSVPRGAHADVSEIPELLVLGLDDLDAVVARHHRERRGEVTHAERILVEEVHKHLALNAYATLKPVVAGMQERFERACEQVLVEAGGVEPSVEQITRKLMRRLLNEALVQIKEGTREAFSEDDIKGSYRRYLEES